MTKFEDRLRTSLHAAAELLPDTAERIVTPAPPSPRRVRGPLVGVTVMVGALAIPLLGSLLWFSALGGPRTGDGADSHGLVESSPTASTPTPVTGRRAEPNGAPSRTRNRSRAMMVTRRRSSCRS
jgi:hypothetical protein